MKLDQNILIHPFRFEDFILRNWPFLVRAQRLARGQSMSRVVRKTLVDQ